MRSRAIAYRSAFRPLCHIEEEPKDSEEQSDDTFHALRSMWWPRLEAVSRPAGLEETGVSTALARPTTSRRRAVRLAPIGRAPACGMCSSACMRCMRPGRAAYRRFPASIGGPAIDGCSRRPVDHPIAQLSSQGAGKPAAPIPQAGGIQALRPWGDSHSAAFERWAYARERAEISVRRQKGCITDQLRPLRQQLPPDPADGHVIEGGLEEAARQGTNGWHLHVSRMPHTIEVLHVSRTPHTIYVLHVSRTPYTINVLHVSRAPYTFEVLHVSIEHHTLLTFYTWAERHKWLRFYTSVERHKCTCFEVLHISRASRMIIASQVSRTLLHKGITRISRRDSEGRDETQDVSGLIVTFQVFNPMIRRWEEKIHALSEIILQMSSFVGVAILGAFTCIWQTYECYYAQGRWRKTRLFCKSSSKRA